MESGLNVDLRAYNSINEEDIDSVEVRMIEDTPGTEEKIAVNSVTASAEESGKEAVNVNDNDLESRWSAKGVGQYIELGFPRNYKVTKVKLTGYWYDKEYMFSIQGKNFTNKANRQPGVLEEYNISDLNISGNKLRITGNGNSGSDYNSYRTIEVYGIPVDGPIPGCLQGECKDPVTNQCRPIGANEIVDSSGFCRPKVPEPGGELGTLVNRFVAFADNDTTTGARNVLQQIMKIPGVTQYLFIGDGPYSSRGTAWVNMMKEFFNTAELVSKLLLYRGNHDTESSESIQTQRDINAWYGSYTTPEGLWLHSKQVGNAYLLIMDTEDKDVNFKDREQNQFVLSKIDEAKRLRSEGKIQWIINGSHKPWFTLKGAGSHDPYTSVRNLYLIPFKDAQVDANLHGHNHNMQLDEYNIQ